MRTVGPTVAQDSWSILVSPVSLHPQPFSFSVGETRAQWPWGPVIYQRSPPSKYLKDLVLHGPKLPVCVPQEALVVAAGGSGGGGA